MASSQPSEKADPSPDNITVPNVQSSSSAMAPSETAAAKDLATAPSGAALSAPSTAANSPTSPPPADPTVPNMDIAGSVMSNVYHLLATIMSHVKLTGLLVVGIVTSTVITHFAGIYPALAVDIVLLWALGRVWRREMSVFKVNIREELRRQQGLYKVGCAWYPCRCPI